MLLVSNSIREVIDIYLFDVVQLDRIHVFQGCLSVFH